MTDLHRPDSPPGTGGTPPPDPKQAVKEEAGQVASTAAEHGKQTATVAAEATSQVAGTAAEGAKEVASQAAQQATEVTKEASEQARQLVEKAQGDLRQQASSQAERATNGLRDVSKQVRALAEGRTDEAGVALDTARQVADKINEAASWLDRRGVDGVIEDVRGLARRRPGVFLLSAAATGFVVGRLGKGMQAASQESSEDGAGMAAAGAGPAALPPVAMSAPLGTPVMPGDGLSEPAYAAPEPPLYPSADPTPYPAPAPAPAPTPYPPATSYGAP
jgi:hypothetical protein